jgi:hypothetical protein
MGGTISNDLSITDFLSPNPMKLKYIKRDRALLLTSILLILMLGAGLFSGIVGFTLGHAALKGVTQPDIRPSNKPVDRQNTKTRGLEVLNEKQLITEAQDVMGIDNKKESDRVKADDQPALVFPIESKDQGIIVNVKSAKPEGNNINLEITLRNQGSQPIKFNAGVLTITGDKEQQIAASTVGLPQSLAANGKDVAMKVFIAKPALGAVRTITLRLTDSERKLQIEIPDIPVVQNSGKAPIKISIPDGKLSTTKEESEADSPNNKTKVKPSPSVKPSPQNTPKANTAPKPAPSNSVTPGEVPNINIPGQDGQ